MEQILETADSEVLEVVEMTKKELRELAKTVGLNEMRELVDTYYQRQEARIREDNRIRQAKAAGEPCELIAYFGEKERATEGEIKYVLTQAIKNYPIATWLTSICGIGPVITAGIIAHIDIHKAVTYGAIQKYAGLDPTSEWSKGQKRPWNATLKTLFWKVGESFVKTSNREKDVYGHIWKERKEYEIGKNERGEYAEQAAKGAAKVGKNTEAYKYYSVGKLPPGHIHARAKRYAVKLLISDLFYVWKALEKEPVALPYPVAQLGHAHVHYPPNLEVVGLTKESIYNLCVNQPQR